MLGTVLQIHLKVNFAILPATNQLTINIGITNPFSANLTPKHFSLSHNTLPTTPNDYVSH